MFQVLNKVTGGKPRATRRSSGGRRVILKALSKSSYIWNIGQTIAHILETLPQEETQTTRKLINSSCSKLNKQDIFLDYLIGRLLLFQDEACISFNSLPSTTVKNRTK